MSVEVFAYLIAGLLVVASGAWIWRDWDRLPQPVIAALVVVIAVVVILCVMIGFLH